MVAPLIVDEVARVVTPETAPELIIMPLIVLVVVAPVMAPDKPRVVTPETAPAEEMTIEGVFRKLVKPVADWKVMPLIVLELVLVAAGKLMPFKVLELLVLVPLARVKSRPETAVAPTAADALVTVSDCSLAPSAVKAVLVRLAVVPEVPVEVRVKPVKVPSEVKEEPTTVEFKLVPVKVPAAAVTVISAEPLKLVPLISLAFCKVVAVPALPETVVWSPVLAPATVAPLLMLEDTTAPATVKAPALVNLLAVEKKLMSPLVA